MRSEVIHMKTIVTESMFFKLTTHFEPALLLEGNVYPIKEFNEFVKLAREHNVGRVRVAVRDTDRIRTLVMGIEEITDQPKYLHSESFSLECVKGNILVLFREV
jgi:hypothetical protein